MESQSWKNLGVERRRPDLADVVLAVVVWYLLHMQPQVPEAMAASAAALMLRCVRINRPAGKRR